MDSRQLTCFICVAKYLNFTRAAEACYITQTSMSHQIASLENELGVQLFERNNRTVRLTPQGEIFLKEAYVITERTKQAVHLVRSAASKSASTLAIGFSGRILCKQLPRLLQQYRTEQPNLLITLKHGDLSMLIEMLENEVIDCFLSIDFAFLSTLDWMKKQTLFKDKICAVIPKSNPLSLLDTVSPEQLQNQPFIVFDGKGVSEKYSSFATNYSQLHILTKAESPELTELLVNSGYGLTFCLTSMADYYNPYVTYARIDPPLKEENIVVCYKKSNDKPGLQDFFIKLDSLFH